MNRALLARCAVVVLVAGFGGTSFAAEPAPVFVRIGVVSTVTSLVPIPTMCKKGQVTTTAGKPCDSPIRIVQETRTTKQSFSLTCNPTGGTLPLAAQVCEDIHRYPTTMLNPPPPQPYSGYHICSGMIFASTKMTVSATASGTPSRFNGQVSGCVSTAPPYEALLIYEAAISGKKAALTALEQRLG